MKYFFWIFALLWIVWVFTDWVDDSETGVLWLFIVMLLVCTLLIVKAYQDKAKQDKDSVLDTKLKNIQIQKEMEELEQLKTKRDLLK